MAKWFSGHVDPLDVLEGNHFRNKGVARAETAQIAAQIAADHNANEGRADILATLRVADQWIKLLVEEMEIEPSETTVTVSAVSPDAKRELVKLNLAESQSQIATAIAKAEAA